MIYAKKKKKEKNNNGKGSSMRIGSIVGICSQDTPIIC